MDKILRDILIFAAKSNASDVHLSSGEQPMLRVLGEMKRLDIQPIPHEDLQRLLLGLLNKRQQEIFEQYHDVDLALGLNDIARLRINIFQHYHGIGGAIRILPREIRTMDDLLMPPVLKDFLKRPKGLILVTGPAGCGKSTTLAAMLKEINRTRRAHIVTIEDPVEYVHDPIQSIIHQREIGVHTVGYARALYNALREDPDIILVGEMRDPETIRYALQAAETGHLVLSTLHTNSSSETIDRIINIFPAEQHQQVRTLLSSVLIGVISQRLLPRAYKNDLIALMEILVVNSAARNLIREGKTYQLPSVLQTGVDDGMQTFEMAFDKLRQNNLISPKLELSDFI